MMMMMMMMMMITPCSSYPIVMPLTVVTVVWQRLGAAAVHSAVRERNGATAHGHSASNEASSSKTSANTPTALNLFPPVPERRPSPHPSPQTARSSIHVAIHMRLWYIFIFIIESYTHKHTVLKRGKNKIIIQSVKGTGRYKYLW